MPLIVIIDDDVDIVEASTLILQSRGFSVLSANNPNAGYQLIKEKNPDLVILDVMMDEPDDGFFLAQKLRREKNNVPILMYTSVSKTIGFEFGANDMVPVNDFVEKPISPDQLIEKVNLLLNK
ncbi:MAG: response regulator [Chlorobiaceae bacterium]|nr:response regulator [Chlorobiaceae bacterium]MBA4309379.1 response regulator [Chlorobiaceae bacterium]